MVQYRGGNNLINWKFDPNNVEDRTYEPLPVGDYRVRIENVEEGQGKEYPYYKLTLKVSGDNRKLWYYLSFMDGEKRKYTNTNLANIFDSFEIPVGELNYQKWIGKTGAVRVKHDMYNGEPQAKVSYFIKREKQGNLAPWREEAAPPLNIDDDFSLMDEDDDIPF